MKYLLAAGATLGLTSASLASLNANAARMMQAANATRTARGQRAFVGNVETLFNPINGYGCWCYLDSEWRDQNQVAINRASIQAHGQTVDAIDESCKDLINSYKCIEMDAEAQGIFDCDAQAVEYIPYNFFSQQTGIVDECSSTNAVASLPGVVPATAGGFCAIQTCIVEGTFTMRYLTQLTALVLDPSSKPMTLLDDYDATHAHIGNNAGTANGIFDPEVECPGIPNPVGSQKQCCGEHVSLSRHPFRLTTGFTTRACCGTTVINEEEHQCCNGNPTELGLSC